MSNFSNLILEKPKREKGNGEPEASKVIQEFLRDAVLRGVSPATKRSYESHIKPFELYLEAHEIKLKDLTSHDLKNFISELMAKNLSIPTINDYIRTFKQFLKWAQIEGLIDKDPSIGIKKLKEPKREKPILSPKEVSMLIRSFSPYTFLGSRNRAIIRLMYDCGLRRSEVANINMENLNLDKKLVGVTGKGSKFAWLPFGPKTSQQMRMWLKFRGTNGSPNLFIAHDGHSVGKDFITHMIIKAGRKVGLKVYPHLLRHSVITWLAEQGMNPLDLQAFARHEDFKTTTHYIQKAALAQRLPAEHKRFGPGEKI